MVIHARRLLKLLLVLADHLTRRRLRDAIDLALVLACSHWKLLFEILNHGLVLLLFFLSLIAFHLLVVFYRGRVRKCDLECFLGLVDLVGLNAEGMNTLSAIAESAKSLLEAIAWNIRGIARWPQLDLQRFVMLKLIHLNHGVRANRVFANKHIRFVRRREVRDHVAPH